MKKITIFTLLLTIFFSFSNLGYCQVFGDETNEGGQNAVESMYSRSKMSPSARSCYLEYQLCNTPVPIAACYHNFMDCINGVTDFEPISDLDGTVCKNMCNIEYTFCKMREAKSAEEHDGAGKIFFCDSDRDMCIHECNPDDEGEDLTTVFEPK